MSKWNTTQAEHLEQNLGMLTHALSKDLPVSEKVAQRLRVARLQALDAQKSTETVPEYAYVGQARTPWNISSNFISISFSLMLIVLAIPHCSKSLSLVQYFIFCSLFPFAFSK